MDEMASSGQKVIIFDDYICETNQHYIIDYFIQERQKKCCVICVS